jgi:putative ABC transport system substrate-binding protein
MQFGQLKRREFITLLGAAAAGWPLASGAQQANRTSRIGMLLPGADGEVQAQARNAVFRQALVQLGWTAGRNVQIDYGWEASNMERARRLAAELIRLEPSILLGANSLCADALRRETRSIPIVFVNATDPVSSGLVDSMARPGANVTGFANYEFSIGGKWLGTLKEAAAGVKRVLVIFAPDNVGAAGLLRAIEAAAPTFGIEAVVPAPVRAAPDIERVFQPFARATDGGLMVLPGFVGLDNRDLIVGLASRHRLPAIYAERAFIAAGGMMTYDTDVSDLFRRAAAYVDRILKGEKPSDLPVQLPTKFDLMINLKVARSLGLTIPLPLLLSADEVIE